MSELTITVSEKGVRNVHGHVQSISEGNALGCLTSRIALAVDLLDRTAKETDGVIATDDECIPQIFVPRASDGKTYFEPLTLHVAPAIRSFYAIEVVPEWFVNAMKLGFSDDRNAMLWSEEFDPRETALLIFSNDVERWAVFGIGWSASERVKLALVVEPKVVDAKYIELLTAFCEKTNLTFRIMGASWSQPSATLRIEIFPEGQV